MADIRVDGMRKFDQALAEIGSRRTATTIGRAAARAGSRPIITSARANLSGVNDTGALKRAIKLKLKQYGGLILAVIGAESKKDGRTGRNPANYAHLVEFGTAPHQVGNRQHPGAKAHPFLGPAFDSSVPESLRRTAAKAKEKLREAALKARRN